MQYPATTATTRRKKPLTSAGKIACRCSELFIMLYGTVIARKPSVRLIGGGIWLAGHVSNWQDSYQHSTRRRRQGLPQMHYSSPAAPSSSASVSVAVFLADAGLA